MTTNFPDRETLRSALLLAVRAPSIHNSQPWQWRVGGQSLHLYANPKLLLPHTDPEARDFILSCGATLNHCQIALAALGWQSKVQRVPNPDDPNHLAAFKLHRCQATESEVALAAAIPRRRTDRRHYSPWQVPQHDIAMMGARAARAGVMLRRVDAIANLTRLISDAASRHAADYEYLAELATWSGRYASTAGVPARSTPEPDTNAALPARSFAGGVLPQTPDGVAADDSAVVVALGTAEDDRLAWLRAGEATSLVLLTATVAGLATCPITEPLEIPELRAQVAQDVFGTDGYPQMMLRIGWAPINADPLTATPRRPLSEVVTRLDGTRFD
jgi:nitroreductase